jgi:hypothetical protein
MSKYQGEKFFNRFSHSEYLWRGNRYAATLLRRLETLTFLIRLQVLRKPLGGELTYVQILKNDGPNTLTGDAQLLTC